MDVLFAGKSLRNLLSLILMLGVLTAQAADRSWSGGGVDARWGTSGNWDAAVTNNDNLTFVTANQQNSTNDILSSIGSLQFGAGGFSLYSSLTNPLSLGIAVTNVSGNNTLGMDLTVPSPRVVHVASPGDVLAMSGILSGNGGVKKSGPGTLALSGINLYTNVTTVNNGVLQLGTNRVSSTPPVSGYTVWLDAFDVNGNGVPPANGTILTVWTNKAVTGAIGHFPALASGAQAPTFFTNSAGFSSRPVVRVYGNNTAYSICYNANNMPAPVSVFYVGRLTGQANYRLLGAWNSGTGSNWLLGYWGGKKDVGHFDGWVTGLSTEADTGANLYEAVIPGSGTNSSVFRNGTLLASNTGGVAGPNGLKVGGGYGGAGSEYSSGEIGEVLVYPRAVTGTERAQIERYLLQKWGLGPLPDGMDVAVAPAGTLDLNGITQDLGALNDVSGSGGVVTNGAAGTIGTLTLGTGNKSATFSGVIVNGPGTIAMNKSGTGSLMLAGTQPNTFTGLTVFSQGILTLAKSANTTAICGPILMTGGSQPEIIASASGQFGASVTLDTTGGSNWLRLSLMGTDQTLGGVTDPTSRLIIQNGSLGGGVGPRNSTLTINNAGPSSVNGYIRDNDNGNTTIKLALVKMGNGTLTLGGGNISLSGGVVVSGGALALGNGGASGTIPNSAIIVTNGAVLQFVTSDATGYNVTQPLYLYGSTLTKPTGSFHDTLRRPIYLAGGTITTPDAGDGTPYNLYGCSVSTLADSGISSISAAGPIDLRNNGGWPTFNIGSNSTLVVSSLLKSFGAAEGLTVSGPGTMLLTATNTFTGATTVNGSTLALGVTASIASTPSVTLSNGAIFDVSAKTGYVLTNQTLQGSGTVTGSVTVVSGGKVIVGGQAAVGTLGFGNDLTLLAGATNTFDLVGSSCDQLNVGGVLTPSANKILINTIGVPSNGTYRLVNYGSAVGAFDGTPINFSRKTMTLDQSVGGQVNLTVSGSGGLVTWAPTVSGTWDVDVSSNWFNVNTVVQDTFYNGDVAVFDDGGAGTGTVTIASVVIPAGVVANSASNYVFAGGGKITGVGGLVKNGAGTLTVTMANDFTGGTLISNGAVRVSTNLALGSVAPVLLSGGALELSNNVTMTYPLALVGDGVASGGSLRSVGGTNACSGAITLKGDSRINSDGGQLTLSSAITLAPTTNVTFGGAGSIVANGGITGTGGMTKDGPGVLQLNTFNNNTAGMTVNSGVLLLNYGPGGPGTVVNTLTVNSGAVVTSLVANTFGWDSGNGSANRSVTNVVINGGAVVMPVGIGQHFWGNRLTMTGGTLTMGAAVQFGGNNPNNTMVVINPASTTAFMNGVGPIHLRESNPNNQLEFNVADGAPAVDLEVDAVIDQAAAGYGILKSGPGTMLCNNGANSYSGITTINGGVLAFGPTTSISNCPTITVSSGAVWDVSAAGYALLGTQTLQGGGSVTGNVTTAAGTKILAGTAGTAGTLAFANNLTINAGATNTFDLASDTTVGAGVNDLITVAGDLAGNGSVILINQLSPLTNGTYRLFTYANNLPTGFNTTVLGNSAGRGTWTLDTSVPHQVNLVVSGVATPLLWKGYASATWDTSSVNWSNLSTVASDFFHNGDEVMFDDSGAVVANVSVGATVSPFAVVVNASNNYTFAGAGKITGGAPLTKSGAGTLTLNNGSDYSGATTVNGGVLALKATTAFNSPVVLNAGNLLCDSTGNYVMLPKAISGAGFLTVTNNANWTYLTADNTYSGGTLVLNPGSLMLGNNTASGSVVGVITNNGNLGLYRSGTALFTNTVTGSGSLYVYNNPVVANGASISQGGSLWLANGNASVLSVTNGGSVVINGHGWLTSINQNQRGTVNVSGGSFTVVGSVSDDRDSWFQFIQSGGVVNLGGLYANWTSSGNGGGTGYESTYTLTGGQFIIKDISGGNATSWSRAIGLYLGGGTLTASASYTMYAHTVNLTGINGNTVIDTQGYSLGSGYAWTGNGGFTKIGSGTLTLSTSNTYTGETRVVAGELRVSDGNAVAYSTINMGSSGTDSGRVAFATSPVTVAGVTGLRDLGVTNTTGAAVTLNVGNNNVSSTFAGGFAGPGSLVKIGAGTLTLSGMNTLSGNTTVNAGTLVLVTGASVSNCPAVTVKAGAVLDVSGLGSPFNVLDGKTLQGAGVVSGGVTVAMSGRILPGGSGVAGTLTVVGNVMLGTGATNTFDLGSSHGIGGGTNDLMVVVGDLNANGSKIAVSLLSPLTAGTYRLFTYSGNLTGAFDPVVLGNTMRGTTLAIDTNTLGQVNLTVTTGLPEPLIWRATSTTDWDVNNHANWFDTLTSSNDVFFQGDAVTFDDSASSTAVNLSSAIVPASMHVNSASNYTFSGTGSIAGSGGLTKDGAGKLTFSSSNAFSGVAAVNAGVVRVSNNAGLGQAGVAVAAGGALEVTGGITVSNAVTLIGSGVVDGGALRDVSGNNIYAGPVTLMSNSWISVDAGTFTVSGTIAGTKALVKGGSANVILTASNTFSGGTIITNGLLQVRHNNALGTGAVIVGPGGQLQLGPNGLVMSNNVTLNGYYTVASSWPVGNGALMGGSDAGGVNTYLDGTLTLAGASNNVSSWWSDKTFWMRGKITGPGMLVIDSTAGSAGSRVVVQNPNCDWQGGTVINQISGNSCYLYAYARVPGNIQIGNRTSGSAYMQMNLINGVSPDGVISFSGTWGNLQYWQLMGFSQTCGGINEVTVGGGGVIENGNGNPSTLTVNNLGDNAFGSYLRDNSGVLTLVKGEMGTLRLSGANITYSGGTTINGGAVLANNPAGSSGTGSGAVQVNNGGTLGGTGSVAGVVNVAAGGTVVPGDPLVNSGVSRLVTGSNVTFQAGAMLKTRMKDLSCNTLVVAGNAVISNVTWSVSALSDNLTVNGAYTAVVASAVSGQFAGVPDGAQMKLGTIRMQVSYTGQAVLLRRMATGFLIMIE